MTQSVDTPVLIVGAGPTGLTLAIMLRLYGVAVRIIDRNLQPSSVSKALGVWSASLEALDAMGVITPFETDGVRLRSLIVGDGPRQLATLAVGDGIDSPYPYPLLLAQSRTEEILGARLAELGTTVERGVELTGFAQDAGGVTAQLKHADGREEAAPAPYLVGCDGARSAVRRGLEIEFEGYTEPQVYLLGDVKIDGGALDRRSIYVWWGENGTVALFPFEPDIWRVVVARPDDADQSEPTVAELQGHMDRNGPPGTTLRDPSWLSAFRINERLAKSYGTGRIFIAGDAAHIHSPAGGQGMNTGIQDAFNLGWKLAHVLQGRGDAELLLASYEPERRPIAHDVVKGAAQKLHVGYATSRITRLIRDVAVTVLGNLPAAQKKLQVELSETTVTYHDGPLVALGAPPRRPSRTEVGTRAREAHFSDPATGARTALWPLLGGTCHTLLLFPDAGQAIDTHLLDGLGDAVRVVTIPPASDPQGEVRKAYDIHGSSWVLVRPDQVIAARGRSGDLAPLAKYLDRVVRPRTNQSPH